MESLTESWADLLATLASFAEWTFTDVVLVATVLGLPALYGVYAHRRDRRKEGKP